MGKKIYTTYEIAKMLEATQNTVANWINEGKIKAFCTPGGHRRVKKKELLEFLDQYNIPVPEELEGKKKILIVEDDPKVVKLLLKLLKDLDYEIITAPDGFQAGQALSDHSPDLVILDVMLPGIDGFKVAELIHNKNKGIKIIAITGYDSEETKEKIMSAGASVYLTKPFDNEEMLTNIEKLLKNS